MLEILYHPIGVVHSPFKQPEGTPIQAVAAKNTQAVIEIFPEFVQGLCDLEHFSHIIVLYHLHLAKKKGLMVIPFLDTKPHGVFATRSPGRPNPIGFSVVRLDKIEDHQIFVKDIDILDGSPVLDVKPYISQFDAFETTKMCWLGENIHKLNKTKDDGRFK